MNWVQVLQLGHVLSNMVRKLPEENAIIVYPLQLGHVLSNMVSKGQPDAPHRLHQASIGPCPFKHGKRNGAVVRTFRVQLQLGHVLSNMVSVMKESIAEHHTELQLGHVLSNMVSGTTARTMDCSACFNWAMSFQTW
mgnify:CR=1 FL=1